MKNYKCRKKSCRKWRQVSSSLHDTLNASYRYDIRQILKSTSLKRVSRPLISRSKCNEQITTRQPHNHSPDATFRVISLIANAGWRSVFHDFRLTSS